MTDSLYEDLYTFVVTLVSNVVIHGCFGRLLSWLPVLPIFLGCYSYVVAPEAFCSACVSYLIIIIIIMVDCIIWVQFNIDRLCVYVVASLSD
jgi:hypothetical protein